MQQAPPVGTRRLLAAAIALASSIAVSGCVDEDPCNVGSERCNGDTVQYCLGPVDGAAWVNDHTCTSGTKCTEQGCTGGHTACCVVP